MSSNESGRSPTRWWQWVLMYPTAVVAFVGAVPTYDNLYESFKEDIPFTKVWEARAQSSLWDRNSNCVERDFSEQQTANNVKIGTKVCDSGDILIKVESPQNGASYHWVELHSFEYQKNSLLGLIVPRAFAGSFTQSEGFKVAVTGKKVVCQKRLSKKLLKRHIQEGSGQCYVEIINTFTGKVVSQETVPCNRGC